MPDVFANITSVPDDMLEVIADVLEMRAAIPSQQEMLQDYLSEIPFPENAEVLEVGCRHGPRLPHSDEAAECSQSSWCRPVSGVSGQSTGFV